MHNLYLLPLDCFYSKNKYIVIPRRKRMYIVIGIMIKDYLKVTVTIFKNSYIVTVNIF